MAMFKLLTKENKIMFEKEIENPSKGVKISHNTGWIEYKDMNDSPYFMELGNIKATLEMTITKYNKICFVCKGRTEENNFFLCVVIPGTDNSRPSFRGSVSITPNKEK